MRQPIRTFLILVAVLIGIATAPLPARAGLKADVTHGYSLIDQWRFDELTPYIETLKQKYPKSGDVTFLRARAEFYNGDYDQAWKLLRDVDDSPAMVKKFKSLVKNTREATRGFVTHESEHFIFYYPDGPDQVLIPFAEKALEQSYETLGAILKYYPHKKVRVEIYPDRTPFSRISPLTLKDIMVSGTVALCKYNRIMLISPGSLVRGYNWLDTLSHEYTHFLLSSKSNNNVPLWLHEGVAKYLESRWRSNEKHLSPIMETVLADGLLNDYMVELESMMPSFAKLKSAEDVQLAYAEVATMVDYMVHLKGDGAIAQLVEYLTQDRSIENALQSLFGLTLEEFQTQWKEHMHQQKLQRIPGLTVLKFQFKKKQTDTETAAGVPPTQKAVGSPRAHDLTMLGDILKARQFTEAAIIEYEKAIKESRTLSPVLYNKLAATYLINKQDRKAETLLKESLRYYPMFHTTLTHLGEVYFMRKDYPKAERFYRQAEKINPFNPMVHARLITLYSAQGKTWEKENQVRLYSHIK